MEEEKLKEKLHFKFAVAMTALIIIIIGVCISLIPNELDVEYIKENFIPDVSDFQAEKSELLQYVILTISYPILFMINFEITKKTAFDKIKHKKALINGINIISAILLFIAVSIIWMRNEFILFKYYSVARYSLVTLLISYICTIMCIKLYAKKKNKIVNIIIYIIVSFLIIIASYLFINPNYEQNYYMRHHVDAYFYPIQKVISGLTIGIDFNCLYGNYAYIYAIMLKILPISNVMLAFSIVIAILTLITFFNYTLFLNRQIKNKVLLLCGMLAIIYFAAVKPFLTNASPYLQYVPHRVICISALLLLITIYFKYREKNCKLFLEILGFVLASFSIAWNLETGAIVLIAWYLFLCYENVYFNTLKEKITYVTIARHTIMAIGSVLLYIVSVELIAFIRTQNLIEIKSIIFGPEMFLNQGFFMIKMNLFSPWLLIVVLYAVYLAISLKNIKILNANNKKEEFESNAVFFILPVIGMGIFNYYLGRSHWEVLGSVIYPAIMLLTIVIDRLINNEKKSKGIIKPAIGFLLLFPLVCFGTTTIYSSYTQKRISLFWDKEFLNKNNLLECRREQIKKIEEKIGNIEILATNESMLYASLHKKDCKRMNGYVDIFSYDDVKKVLNYLENDTKALYIEKRLYDKMQSKYASEIENIINKKYNVYEINNDILIVPIELENMAIQIEGIEEYK